VIISHSDIEDLEVRTRMTTDSLQSAAYATMRAFGRVGCSYPVYFRPQADWEVIAAEELLSVDNLRGYFTRAIKEWSDHPSEEDQRAAASRFLRRYVGSVAAAALMPLSAGVALDVSIPRVKLVIRSELALGTIVDLTGAPVYVSPARPTQWPVEGVSLASVEQLRHRAYESLFRDHLVPAFERVRAVIGVSARLVWATAAECVEYLYENARPYFDDAGWAPLDEDRRVVHYADTVPGIDGPNPMKGLMEWEDFDDPDLPRPMQLRRICCVNYVIPGRGSNPYCRSCGLLTAEQRHQLWRQYVIQGRQETSCRWPPLG
jgi:ferric iron reductase protein FhuF